MNCESVLENACWDYKYIDLISTAYSIDGIAGKSDIQEKIDNCIDLYSPKQQFEIFNKLFHYNIRSYENQTITDFEFSAGFIFNPDALISNCVFINCVFDSCHFFEESFLNCQFYNCTFYHPTVNLTTQKDCFLSFFDCKDVV